MTTNESSHVALVRELAEAYVGRALATVAVVGNAPLEASAERARRVDSCDAVVRVNGFAVDADLHRPVVGNRVDVVMFNRALRASPHFFHAYSERLYLMIEPGRLHWEPETWPSWWPADLGFVVVSNRDLTLPLSRALGIDTKAQAIWATTGTMAVYFSSLLFPSARLLLAGFSFVRRPHQTRWDHAWGAPSAVGAEHLIERESTLLKSWIAAGKAEFVA